jgi:hypothetical protein
MGHPYQFLLIALTPQEILAKTSGTPSPGFSTCVQLWFGRNLAFSCVGEKPWSSGLGRWLMTKRSWVQTPAPYTRSVVLKPGVATHLCVAKILRCVAKIEHFLKLLKKVNHSYHTKGFCWRLFAHCPYIINLSLHKRYYSVVSCFSKQLNGLNLVY